MIIVKEQTRLHLFFVDCLFSLQTYTFSKLKSAALFVFIRLNICCDVRKLTKSIRPTVLFGNTCHDIIHICANFHVSKNVMDLLEVVLYAICS